MPLKLSIYTGNFPQLLDYAPATALDGNLVVGANSTRCVRACLDIGNWHAIKSNTSLPLKP